MLKKSENFKRKTYVYYACFCMLFLFDAFLACFCVHFCLRLLYVFFAFFFMRFLKDTGGWDLLSKHKYSSPPPPGHMFFLVWCSQQQHQHWWICAFLSANFLLCCLHFIMYMYFCLMPHSHCAVPVHRWHMSEYMEKKNILPAMDRQKSNVYVTFNTYILYTTDLTH